MCEEVEIYLHQLLTSTLGLDEWSVLRPGEWAHRFPLDMRLGASWPVRALWRNTYLPPAAMESIRHKYSHNYGKSHLCVDRIKMRIMSMTLLLCAEQGSAAGTATGCGINDREAGVRVPVWPRIVSSPQDPKQTLGTKQPPVHGVRGFRG
jgi:hypothetical protein